jgi:hypothetical protein
MFFWLCHFSTAVSIENAWSSSGGITNDASAALSALAGSETANDANSLGFSVRAPTGLTAVFISFLFASDKVPIRPVSDIFGHFIDGVHDAKFPNVALLQNQSCLSNLKA